jgi:hypothetical protein
MKGEIISPYTSRFTLAYFEYHSALAEHVFNEGPEIG